LLGSRKNPFDILASLFLILLGIVVLIGAIGLGVGTPTEPKPGFFPALSGSVLAGLSLLLLFKAWHGGSFRSQAFGKLRGPLTMVIGFGIYVAILNVTGYVIATVILSLVLLHILETKSWRVLFVTSVVLAVGTYILFDRILGVELPAGILARFG
jgi:hypothetical protein